MNSVKHTYDKDYVKVSNQLIGCKDISPLARLLFIYLSAQSNEFTFNNADLCEVIDCKEPTLRKYLKELLELGLISRQRTMKDGKLSYYEYTTYDPTNILPYKKSTLEKIDSRKSDRSLTKKNSSNEEYSANEAQDGKADPVKESFEQFWDAYGKKRDRKKSYTAWKNLSKKNREACLAAVPAYVASTPDIQFRKLPATYLHGENWNDEIKPALYLASSAGGYPAATDPAGDIELSAEWEASYQKFTGELYTAMGNRAGKVLPLSRSEFKAWTTHQRRPLTKRLAKRDFCRRMLQQVRANVPDMNTYVLSKEIKTTDRRLWFAFDWFLKENGYVGEYQERAAL